jgi:hypothetical protein
VLGVAIDMRGERPSPASGSGCLHYRLELGPRDPVSYDLRYVQMSSWGKPTEER